MTTPERPADPSILFVPCLSRTPGQTGFRAPQGMRDSCLSPVPLPSGGTDRIEPSAQSTPLSVPNDGTNTQFRPGTTWLITDRTRPAWTAVLDLLDDGRSHPVELVATAMRDTAGLAPRTIKAHLRSASRRGWITNRGGRVTLRDRGAIEQALRPPEAP